MILCLPSPHSSSGISPFLFITLSSFLSHLVFFSFHSVSSIFFTRCLASVCIFLPCDNLILSRSLPRISLSFFLSLFVAIGLTEYFSNSFSILLSCEIGQNYDLNEHKMSLNARKRRRHCVHSISVTPYPTVKSTFLYSGLVYHVQSLSRLRMSALCKSLPARTNKPGPINVNPHSLGQSMSFPLLQNWV